MTRGIFGWDLPPGVTMRQIEEAAGGESPCAVCGHWADDCICPTCPHCGSQGDPVCYQCSDCGPLLKNEAQILGNALLNEAIAEEARREEEYYRALEASRETYYQQTKEYGDGE